MLVIDQMDFLFNNINTIIMLILVIVVPLIILNIVTKTVLKLSKSNSFEETSILSLLKLIRYCVFIIIFLACLDVMGINLHSLFVSLGLVSVAMSLAAKDTLSNVISGLIIFIEKKFQVDDMIEIDNQKGQVDKIGLKAVQLRSNAGLIIIPNILFSTKPFVNYTRNGYYIESFTVFLKNEYILDEKIEQMTQILEKSTLILKDPKYKIFVKNMTEEGVEVLVKVAVDNPLDDSYIISELMKEFKRKIEIEDKK